MITERPTDHIARGNIVYRRIEGHCLSTDEKPTTGILNGSMLIEMDTGKLFFYDEAGTTWYEFGG